MLIVGLTGSIGMGKSTVANRLRERGIHVCDADALVHQLYEGVAVAPVEAAFPGSTTDGRVDRQKLSAMLVRDPSGFRRLEEIVHPLVFDVTRECLRIAKASGSPFAVVENALMLETHGERRCDLVVVVSAPAEKQRERVMARPGMTPEKLDAILARQMPDAEKRRLAQHVIDTGGTMEDTLAQVDRLIDQLSIRSGTAYQVHWT